MELIYIFHCTYFYLIPKYSQLRHQLHNTISYIKYFKYEVNTNSLTDIKHLLSPFSFYSKIREVMNNPFLLLYCLTMLMGTNI